MSKDKQSRWAISSDGENYGHVDFLTKGDAIREGRSLHPNDTFYVGQIEAPPPPENLWRAEDWLEHVSVQDAYCGEHAEDWDMSTKEQREELEATVSKVMAIWLDHHNLRPTFWNIGDAEEIAPLE